MVVTRDRARVRSAPADGRCSSLFMLWMTHDAAVRRSRSTAAMRMWNEGHEDRFHDPRRAGADQHAHSTSSRSPGCWLFSLGVYGVKGGIFTIVNGGDHRVWGPPGTSSRATTSSRSRSRDDDSADALPADAAEDALGACDWAMAMLCAERRRCAGHAVARRAACHRRDGGRVVVARPTEGSCSDVADRDHRHRDRRVHARANGSRG